MPRLPLLAAALVAAMAAPAPSRAAPALPATRAAPATRATPATPATPLAPASSSSPGDLFTLSGRAPRHATLTAGDAPAPITPASDRPAGPPSPMLDALDGVLARLDARALASLRRSAQPMRADPPPLRRLGVLNLHAEPAPPTGPATAAPIEILCSPDGGWFARPLSRPADLVRLDPAHAGDLMLGWAAPIPPPGADPADAPRWPGRLLLTDPIVTARFTGPGRGRAASGLPPMQRDLRDERFHIRLPANHDPAAQAGVLLWISPLDHTPWWDEPDGAVATFGPACDDLGLILVGAEHNGNDRPILDRLQVAFDMLETVRRNVWIDDARVYITGMSGGGKCSFILLSMAPEVFAGAVPIVGLTSWHTVPLDAGTYLPRGFAKPDRRRLALLADRPVFSITGSADFNRHEMLERTRLLADDGVPARIDEIAAMAHAMPPPERFTAALAWVDQQARAPARLAAEEAARMLDAHTTAHGRGPPATPQARASLIAITAHAPWSEPAWAAAELLGYARPGR